jgi:steroid 5-alpha reductase family enzyme
VALVGLWAIRLTANWALSWPGFDHEDFRYVDMRGGLPRGVPWPVVSFVVVQLIPTLMVFVAMLPLWPALGDPSRDFGALDVVAAVVTSAAIVLETVADRQLHAFTGDPANRGRPIEHGLWAWSRHPNYVGEIGFWTGLFLFGLAANPSWWWTLVGPVLIVVMFLSASIPMMEQRSLARRPAYADYQKRVAMLVPLRPRRHMSA